MTVLAAASACRPQTVFEQLIDSRRLTAEILVNFGKAADATNRAVMSGTDEAAMTSVREAQQATRDVQSNTDLLRPILDGLRYAKESQLLGEFETKFAEYRSLDSQIQQLVVDNTNLKALRLSWGPAFKAADAYRDAIVAIRPDIHASPHGEALVATALSSVREIQALQAPHIAESDDASMTSIEKRMATAADTARTSMKALSSLVPETSSANLNAAVNALEQFVTLNTEILTLSRRNSNMHALALSLGQKRSLVATCEETIRTLQRELANRGFPGTR